MLYVLTADGEAQDRVRIEAKRRWAIPRLSCEVCEREVVDAGESYPCVDLAGHDVERALLDRRRPISRAEHAAICSAVKPYAPPEALLMPGCQFGELSGTIRGKIPDIISPLGDKWIVREETMRRLAAAGVRWPAACPALLKPMGKTDTGGALLELQMLPVVTLQTTERPDDIRICPACKVEVWRRGRLRPLAYFANTVPAEADMFRVRNWFSQVVVTERFRTAATASAVTGVTFEAVPPTAGVR